MTVQEDSAQNCAGLQLKAPKRDFYKLMNKGKVVLRFKVIFANTGATPLAPVDRCGSGCCQTMLSL